MNDYLSIKNIYGLTSRDYLMTTQEKSTSKYDIRKKTLFYIAKSNGKNTYIKLGSAELKQQNNVYVDYIKLEFETEKMLFSSILDKINKDMFPMRDTTLLDIKEDMEYFIDLLYNKGV